MPESIKLVIKSVPVRWEFGQILNVIFSNASCQLVDSREKALPPNDLNALSISPIEGVSNLK
jgi:hypothetical protein